MAQLDIWSDVACPWCFLGKRRLAMALAALPEGERPSVTWHAYQLMPDFPLGTSTPARQLLEQKFGGAGRLGAMYAQLAQVGAEVGVHFDVDAQLACNTQLAHRAIAVASRFGQQDAVVEALFAAFFERGRDLSRPETVVELLAANVSDVDAQTLQTALMDDEASQSVQRDRVVAEQLGIRGVPFFLLDRRLALSGAQDPSTFLAFLTEGQRRSRDVDADALEGEA
jgi:predicted DsbA family dithiol-disulfide isomerase